MKGLNRIPFGCQQIRYAQAGRECHNWQDPFSDLDSDFLSLEDLKNAGIAHIAFWC